MSDKAKGCYKGRRLVSPFWAMKSLFGFNGWLTSLLPGPKYENTTIRLILASLFKSHLFLFEIHLKRSHVSEFLNRSFAFKWLLKYQSRITHAPLLWKREFTHAKLLVNSTVKRTQNRTFNSNQTINKSLNFLQASECTSNSLNSMI